MAEPLKATFFAFQKRGRSGVLTTTTIAFAVLAGALIAAFAAMFWQSIAPLFSWYGQVIRASVDNDPAAIQAAGFPAAFFSFFGVMLLWMFPFYILCAAYEAACLRWMIHGERAGLLGFSLGAPTWRVWGVYWLWLLLNIAFSFVMSLLMMVVMTAMMISTGGDPSTMATVTPVIYVVQYALMAYFGVRFAPAAAATIAARRFAFFEAWTVTKGRFLPLFGSFALLYLLYFAGSLAVGAAGLLYATGGLPELSGAWNNPQRTAEIMLDAFLAYMDAFTQPSMWPVLAALQAAGVVVILLFYLAMFGVNARAAQAALAEGALKPASA
jgi:hypothetical protein